MAVNISDEGLIEFKHRAKGQTVVITGAARGFGKAVAFVFAKHGANIVIGDIDVKGGEETAVEIQQSGGKAVFTKCNVLEYDDLVHLFETAVKTYGAVDIVVPNAGVNEIGSFTTVRKDANGLPTKPSLKTLDINLTSVMHSTQLAFHYLSKNTRSDSLKSVVVIGSMSSIVGLPIAPVYATAKHALLGMVRSLAPVFEVNGLRIAIVTPWFADTAILPTAFKLFMTGIPMVPVERVAGAIFLAATDDEKDTNGAAYTLPDDREVFRIPPVEINEGVYDLLKQRVVRGKRLLDGFRTFFAFGRLFLGSSFFKLIVGASVGYASYTVAIAKGLV